MSLASLFFCNHSCNNCSSVVHSCYCCCPQLLLLCGVAQLVARRLAVRQARVRISARHHREVFPTEQTSDEDMERGLSEWRWINVLYECDWMNAHVIKIWKINKKSGILLLLLSTVAIAVVHSQGWKKPGLKKKTIPVVFGVFLGFFWFFFGFFWVFLGFFGVFLPRREGF